jgi:hypothetical protein
MMYPEPHSRGLNHVLALFKEVRAAIPEDNERALWALSEIERRYSTNRQRKSVGTVQRTWPWRKNPQRSR